HGWGLKRRSSLAQCVQTIGGRAGEAARKAEDLGAPGAVDGHRRLGAVRLHRTETDLEVEPVRDEVPEYALERLDPLDDRDRARVRLPEGRRLRPSKEPPAGAFGEASTVGPNRRDAGPPVGEVIGLGEQRPHVLAGGE